MHYIHSYLFISLGSVSNLQIKILPLFIVEINEKSRIYIPKKECLNPLMIFPESFITHIRFVDHKLPRGAFIYKSYNKKAIYIQYT